MIRGMSAYRQRIGALGLFALALLLAVGLGVRILFAQESGFARVLETARQAVPNAQFLDAERVPGRSRDVFDVLFMREDGHLVSVRVEQDTGRIVDILGDEVPASPPAGRPAGAPQTVPGRAPPVGGQARPPQPGDPPDGRARDDADRGADRPEPSRPDPGRPEGAAGADRGGDRPEGGGNDRDTSGDRGPDRGDRDSGDRDRDGRDAGGRGGGGSRGGDR